MGTATFILNLPAVFEREGDLTIGRFPDIDVASQGRTREEAERNLIEAAQLFIESCFERNVLDEVLKACGFTPGHSADKPGRDHLTVPVEFARYSQWCRGSLPLMRAACSLLRGSRVHTFANEAVNGFNSSDGPVRVVGYYARPSRRLGRWCMTEAVR